MKFSSAFGGSSSREMRSGREAANCAPAAGQGATFIAIQFPDTEIRQYLDAKLLPLLTIMILVDNDGWTLFEPETKHQYRDETLTAFEKVTRTIAGA
jgi:hypothetical protein